MRSDTRDSLGTGFEEVSKITDDELSLPFDRLALQSKSFGGGKVFKIGRFETQDLGSFIQLENISFFEGSKPWRHRHIGVLQFRLE